MCKNAKDYINMRARRIARHAGLDEASAVLSLRAVSVIGGVLVAADGETNTTTITDANGTAVDGDRFRLQGQGGKKWVLVAMIANNGAANVDPEWGIKDFVFNDNGINKLSFAESLADRSNSAAFFSLEAIRSGIDPFPWQDLPAFGPNDTLDIVAYNTDGAAVVTAQAQFWLMPVPTDYEPIGSNSYDCTPCAGQVRNSKITRS